MTEEFRSNPTLAAVFHDANSQNADAGDPVEIYMSMAEIGAVLDN